MASNSDFEALARSTGLDKFPGTIGSIEKVFVSYRQQLNVLHSVDLEGEEVLTAYQYLYDSD